MSDLPGPLGDRIAAHGLLVVPGAANALAARVVEDAGFEAVYVTGAGVANSYCGVPDIGLTTATELVGHVGAIREAVELPIIADADTGFGNALNVQRTVRALERAGADAIQLEDQTFPKRCGHFAGQEVVEEREMIGKIEAALDARRHPGTLIIARTDARAVHGLTAACDRANAYREAGADVLFVEAPRSVEEVETIANTVPGPKLANFVVGGRTPQLPVDWLREHSFVIALHANLALLAAIEGMQTQLTALREGREPDRLATWAERQRLVGKPLFDTLAERYG